MRGTAMAMVACLLIGAASVFSCGQGPGEETNAGAEAASPAGEGRSVEPVEPVETRAQAACQTAECVEGEGACDGDSRVTCVAGKKVSVPCTDAQCAAEGKGPLLGCLLGDDDKPACVCGCTAKDASCVDDKIISVCSTTATLFKIECTDELCKQEGYKGLKAGSGCKGSSEGAYCDCELNCDPSHVLCDDKSGKAIVTSCDGQKQTKTSCDEVCAQDGEVASPTCSGVNDNGDKVCFCGTGACSTEGAQQCVGNGKVRFCQHGVWVETACSDAACKQAGFSGWSGTCGQGSSGKEACLCN